MKIKSYKVRYSNWSYIIVRAKNKENARKQAWSNLGAYKYGWTKQDFLKNATVEEK